MPGVNTVGVLSSSPRLIGDRMQDHITQFVSRQHRFDDPFQFGHELAVVDIIERSEPHADPPQFGVILIDGEVVLFQQTIAILFQTLVGRERVASRADRGSGGVNVAADNACPTTSCPCSPNTSSTAFWM